MAKASARGEREGLILGVMVLMLALILGGRQWVESKRRMPEDPYEQSYRKRRTTRRSLGSIVMLLLGIGLIIGTRLPHQGSLAAQRAFVAWWVLEGLLALALFLFAFWDLAANVQHGAVLRRQLRDQERQWLHDHAPKAQSGTHGLNVATELNGKHGQSPPGDPAS